MPSVIICRFVSGKANTPTFFKDEIKPSACSIIVVGDISS